MRTKSGSGSPPRKVVELAAHEREHLAVGEVERAAVARAAEQRAQQRRAGRRLCRERGVAEDRAEDVPPLAPGDQEAEPARRVPEWPRRPVPGHHHRHLRVRDALQRRHRARGQQRRERPRRGAGRHGDRDLLRGQLRAVAEPHRERALATGDPLDARAQPHPGAEGVRQGIRELLDAEPQRGQRPARSGRPAAAVAPLGEHRPHQRAVLALHRAHLRERGGARACRDRPRTPRSPSRPRAPRRPRGRCDARRT